MIEEKNWCLKIYFTSHAMLREFNDYVFFISLDKKTLELQNEPFVNW